MSDINKTALRKILRTKRQQIPLSLRTQFAKKIASQFSESDFFNHSQHIAGYIAADGEVDMNEIQSLILAKHKKYYLPILHPLQFSRLWFARHNHGDALIANRYHILEPVAASENLISPWDLDVVLVPLVGFDAQCNRLGMGKGFYDQTFHFLQLSFRRKPILIGVAYEIQKIDSLQINEWDIPLRGIITEENFYRVE